MRALFVVVLVGTVPLALFAPHGPRIVWTVLIATVPLTVVVGGFYWWRRVCPLALFGQLGRLVGRPGRKKIGDGGARVYLYVQLGVLVTSLALRLIATNGTPWALAGFLGVIVLAAIVTSFVYTGKTWCNYLCPVGLVEKIYTEPTGITVDEDNAQCTTCTACKKHCPDIDAEQGYWKEADLAPRRHVYFAWPGIVLAFYGYFWLLAGSWGFYFSGAWAYEMAQVDRALGPGLWFAPSVPVVVAAPLTLVVGGLVSFALFALGERFALARPGADVARVRHRALALAGFAGFVAFYYFAGQPSLAKLPWWGRRAIEAIVIVAATMVLVRRWGRRAQDHVQEKFARGLIKRWEWGDAPPTANPQELVVLHTERTKQREQRLKAYKDTIRDLVADGVLSPGELTLLDKLRGQMGIAEKDHERVLSELGAEEKKLFDPKYRGSIEQRLQAEQYRRDLGRLASMAAAEGRPPDAAALEALRREHKIPAAEHAAALASLRDEAGPLAARLRDEEDAIHALDAAVAWARAAMPASSSGAQYLEFVLDWRRGERLERALGLLSVLSDAKVVAEATAALARGGAVGREAAGVVLGRLLEDARAKRIAELLRSGGSAPRAGDPHEPPRATTPADPAALPTLARDAEPRVRAAAAYVLGRFDDAPTQEALAAACKDSDPVVRETAVRALGARGRLSVEALGAALADPDPRVVRAATRVHDGGGHATLDKNAAVSTLTTLEKAMLLRNVPLFAGLDPVDLQHLTSIAEERRFVTGAALCRVGERSDEVFVVVEGRARAWLQTTGGERVLGDSGPGACIGEMAALDAQPRSANVTATEATRALVLAGAEFKQLLHDRPAIAQGVMAVLTRRLREMISEKMEQR